MKGQFRYMGFEPPKYELGVNPAFSAVDALIRETNERNFLRDWDRAIELNNLPSAKWTGNRVKIPTLDEAVAILERCNDMDAEIKKVSKSDDETKLRYIAGLMGLTDKNAPFDMVLTFLNGVVEKSTVINPTLKDVLTRANFENASKAKGKPDEKPTK